MTSSTSADPTPPMRPSLAARSSFRREWFALVAISLWGVLATPLISEEAYYWLYARHLEWSYFDHPPLLAWMIRVSTTLAGDSRFGVRLAPLSAALLTTWIGLRWIRFEGGGERAQRWWLHASIGCSVLGVFHLLAMPDSMLLPCYVGCVYSLRRARGGELRWWFAAGVCAGFALLAKYTSVFLLVGGVIVLLTDLELRRQLARPGPWIALVVATLLFTPVLAWNVAHDWISISFQSEQRAAAARWNLTRPLVFAASQVVLIGPAATFALWTVVRKTASLSLRTWIAAFAAPMPLLLFAASALVDCKAYWTAAPIACVTVFVALELEKRAEDARPRWFERAPRLGWLVLLVAPAIRFVPQRGGANWLRCDEIAQHAVRHAQALRDAGASHVFFFTDTHRDSAQLAWNLATEADVDLDDVLATDVFGLNGRAFNFWDRPAERVGESAIFVVTDAARKKDPLLRLEPFFASARRVERLEFASFGHVLQTVDFFACEGYRGPQALSK